MFIMILLKKKNPLFKHMWGNETWLDFSVLVVDSSLVGLFIYREN